MTKQSTELAIVEQLNINGMDKPAAQKLLDAYGVPFTEAGKLIEQGRAITVTSEDDTDNMALARKTRLELRTQRIAIEKKHDELKADSLAYGKAVDLVQRVALEQIKPVEEHLKLQEQYAEVKQEERRQARIAERTAELAKYVDDVSVYNYGDMGDEAFALLLDQVKTAKEVADKKAADEAAAAEKARVEKEEADRIAREKAEAELAEEKARNEKKLSRINTINRLGFSFRGNDGYVYDELVVTEKDINNQADEEWVANIVTLQAEISRRKQAAKAAAKLEAERVAKIEAEAAKQKAELEAAEKAKREAEAAAEKKAAEEKAAAEKAAAAPDKEKLLAYVEAIGSIEMPKLSTKPANAVEDRIAKHLSQALEAYRKLINEEL